MRPSNVTPWGTYMKRFEQTIVIGKTANLENKEPTWRQVERTLPSANVSKNTGGASPRTTKPGKRPRRNSDSDSRAALPAKKKMKLAGSHGRPVGRVVSGKMPSAGQRI